MYQPSQGGKTFVPLEKGGRVIGKATPRLAKMLSWKYTKMPGEHTCTDLREHHGIKVSKKLVQTVSKRIGAILAKKEQKWTYTTPDLPAEVAAIGISRDGTTSPIKREGYKETMAGTISLYDQAGSRLHTIYTGAAPEPGKARFNYLLDQEIDRIKAQYPGVTCSGIADGEAGNWQFLRPRTDTQILDYWHATEYLAAYAGWVYRQKEKRAAWLEASCHTLKNEAGGAGKLLAEMKEYATSHSLKSKKNPVLRAVTYFTNQQSRMNYPEYQKQNLPIGSGVVEAACKTLVKQRFSLSGCRWKRTNLDHLLQARSLIMTEGRWNQFWARVDRYGC